MSSKRWTLGLVLFFGNKKKSTGAESRLNGDGAAPPKCVERVRGSTPGTAVPFKYRGPFFPIFRESRMQYWRPGLSWKFVNAGVCYSTNCRYESASYSNAHFSCTVILLSKKSCSIWTSTSSAFAIGTPWDFCPFVNTLVSTWCTPSACWDHFSWWCAEALFEDEVSTQSPYYWLNR